MPAAISVTTNSGLPYAFELTDSLIGSPEQDTRGGDERERHRRGFRRRGAGRELNLPGAPCRNLDDAHISDGEIERRGGLDAHPDREGEFVAGDQEQRAALGHLGVPATWIEYRYRRPHSLQGIGDR